MYYPDDLVEEIRTRNDIVGVISQYVKLTKKGGSYFGLCPFHNEKTPSFSVEPGKQMYYCFGCGAGGNTFTFVMEYENFTFHEAVEALAERAGISLPKQEQTIEEKKNADRRLQMLQANREAARFYYYHLRSASGERALRYLQERQLTPKIIQMFGLGYSPYRGESLYPYLKDKGYSDEILRESGLIKIDERGGRDRFWNRVMFPIMDANSRVIGFGGRVMGDGEPKYLNSPETPLFDKSRNLYGLNLARKTRRSYFLLCEGYMDVISLHQAGLDCAVASLGTALTQGHASLIKRYVSEVVLTFDSDGAGQRAARKAIPLLQNAGLSVRVLDMKPNKDPDEFLKALGREAYEERILRATNAFLFEMDCLAGEYDLHNPEKKTEFGHILAEKLSAFSDELERNNYLDVVCGRYLFHRDTLRELVNRLGARRLSFRDEEEDHEEPEKRRPRKILKTRDKGIREDQYLLLNAIVCGDISRERARELLLASDFSDPVCRKVAEMIYEMGETQGIPEPAVILNQFLDSEEERNQVAGIFHTVLSSQLSPLEQKKRINEAFRRVKRVSLDEQIRHPDDPHHLQEAIGKKTKLESMYICP